MTLIEPYRMARLTGFLNPGADTAGAGFQAAQAKIALGSGGLFGVGIGNGVQKAFYLPEAHTDMITAVIGEELGLVGIVGVVGLFSMLGYAGLQTAKKAKDVYGKILVAGLTSLILVQAVVNLFAVMGLAPLTGVPLPFVSYGNSSLLASLFAVGLILNVGPRRGPPALANSASSKAGASPRVEGVGRAVPERARVVVAAGGTAGHVVPAMAVAAELRDSGAEVSFLGTRERIEAELVPAAGYEIDFIKVRGIDRGNPLKAAARRARGRRRGRRGATARSGAAAPTSCWAAAATSPVRPGLAATLSRTPLVLTEADSHLGLANRLLAGRARRVCLAFPIDGREGEPLRRHRASGPGGRARRRPGAPRGRRFGIPPRRPLPAGGRRQPGRPLDQRVARSPPSPSARGRDFHVVHVAGRRDYAELKPRLRGAPRTTTATRCSSTSPTSATALAACDLVLGRAGGSIFEVTAAGRPAILVPYPHATAGHQATNAAWMERAGAAGVIDDAELGPELLLDSVGALLGDEDAAGGDGGRLERRWRMPDAARRIADEVLAAARAVS